MIHFFRYIEFKKKITFVLEITSITEKTPADESGMRPGDFLFKFQDDLVIFLSQDDILNKLKTYNGLELELEIERGTIQPMTYKNTETHMERNIREEDKFTIILDKQRGIYQK